MPTPDPALTLTVAMQVDCSHFLAVKKPHANSGRKYNLSDEERARRAERARSMTAQTAERRAAAQPDAVPA